MGRERKDGTPDLFSGHDAQVREGDLKQMIEHQMRLAREVLLSRLSQVPSILFNEVLADFLQAHMLRETNVKDICVDLARTGHIENTWGGGNRKPRWNDLIVVKR
jgi:hypothetical protein